VWTGRRANDRPVMRGDHRDRTAKDLLEAWHSIRNRCDSGHCPTRPLQTRWPRGYIAPIMRFEKIWIEQCRATRAIKRRFGVKDALDYLVGEKLRMFVGAARNDAAFARELPRFLAAIWRVFNEYELAGYVAMQVPTVRRQLRALLYFS